MQFNEMNLIAPLQKAVKESGYTVPTPIQEATIPLALSGKDILGCAQTGTGKTAAFVLPILQHLANNRPRREGKRPVRALVLAPTRELAIQNYDTFQLFGKSLGINSTDIFGGVNQSKQVDELQRGTDVLVATPGRLIDLINQGYVKLQELEIFVLDEADRMLDMGFIHDVKRIIALLPEKRQTMLFSATMPKEVEELALSLLIEPATVKVDPVTSTVDKIEQSVYFVSRADKKALLLELLKNKGVNTALVFTRTKSNADQVARLLNKGGIKTMAIHGDKSQNARERALGSFKAGEISVLAATDIAARGIDIIELPYVINYNIPEEAETYIHRIGRTGRAGLGGKAISLCCSDELADWRTIEKLTGLSVPVAQCQWSVQDMQPTKKPPKAPRPPRNDRAPARTPAAAVKSQAKTKAAEQPTSVKPFSARRRWGRSSSRGSGNE